MPVAGLLLRSRPLQWLLTQAVPQLRAWPPREWPAVLGRASAAEYDRIERVGLLAGPALVTWLLRPAESPGADVLRVFISQVLVATPLLLLVLGPLYLRRHRRGVEALHKLRHDKDRPSRGA